MDQQHIQRLLYRFHAGEATEAEGKEIERLLSEGSISLDDLEDFSALEGQIMRLELPGPSASLDKTFYGMLSREKTKQRGLLWAGLFSWPEFAPRLALASVMLLIGLAAGYLIRPDAIPPASAQINDLSKQVSELQEMMMLSLLEKGSATERLKAVSLTQEMDEASKKVTAALIQTLNQDENVNVRLAALEALKPYATDSSVREALVRSIASQESPLVQVSLAELMVALQEKAAVKEFEKILESETMPVEVKKKIAESIQVLT